MQNPFSIRTLMFRSGERFPILVDGISGAPLFDTTVYTLSQLRATAKATNTIEHHLRAIVVLKLFLKFKVIDLDERIRSSQMLKPYEMDDLVQFCKRPLSDALSQLDVEGDKEFKRMVPATDIRRRRLKYDTPQVCGQTGVNRVHAIRDFLDWLVREHASKFSTASRNSIIEAWCQCKIGLEARITSRRRRNQIGRREGADPATIALLFEVISLTSDYNPWKSQAIRFRNQLIVLWLYQLGVRRGELLNIKINDINFRSETVTIARRADDVADPRRHQPLVKTRDRKLPVASALISLTLTYITKYRIENPGAHRHEFLFVSSRSGEPMSLSMINEIFSDIREAMPEQFEGLSPHTLRHTWNDNFSARVDEMKLAQAEETSMRSFLMGWSPTSDTAATYTRRHVRKKAQKASLEMQEKLYVKRGSNE